jgi:septum formation protein
MPTPRIILASTSPYRRELLARLGWPFEAIAPAIDEEALKDPSLGPRGMAEALAEAKALSLTGAHPDSIIIGSDQTCACAGQILNKPGDHAGACAQLTFLSGKTHELYTAVYLVFGNQRHALTDVTRLTMRPLQSAEVERYVAMDQPYDCVGSYKLEQHGIRLFSSIETPDYTAIVGLPLLGLNQILRRLMDD